MDEIAKQVAGKADLVVVENIQGITMNTKLKGRLSKNMRSSIGSWNYSYWLMRVQQNCERNRVSFRTVTPYNTSRTCPICGHIDRMNRVGEIFRCQACDYTDNADLVAARNIKHRFITGKYGTCYKLLNDRILQV
jgi:putative transposase